VCCPIYLHKSWEVPALYFGKGRPTLCFQNIGPRFCRFSQFRVCPGTSIACILRTQPVFLVSQPHLPRRSEWSRNPLFSGSVLLAYGSDPPVAWLVEVVPHSLLLVTLPHYQADLAFVAEGLPLDPSRSPVYITW